MMTLSAGRSEYKEKGDPVLPDKGIIVILRQFIVAMCFCMVATCFASGSPRRYKEFIGVRSGVGFPMSGITSLALDDYGFVWGASRMGIIRATPTDTKKYDLPVSTSDVMHVKLAYNKGVLAASTQNGQIFRYNRLSDRFEQCASLTDILGNTEWITSIVVDDGGNIWISTSTGIFIFSNGTLSRIFSNIKGYTYLLPIKEGKLFAVADRHIYIVDVGDRKLTQLPGEFDSLISSAAFDRWHERVLIGTYWGELWEYSVAGRFMKRIGGADLPCLIIRSVLVPDEDVFLVGMEGGGIVLFDSGSDRVMEVIKNDIDDPSSLKGNRVFAMLSDRMGRLWVATTNGGLQYSDAYGEDIEHVVHRYNTNTSLPNNEINFLLTDRRGNLWAATNDGIGVRKPGEESWRNLYGGRNLSVLSLTEDKEGRIYASTYGEGIYVIDPATGMEIDHFTEKEAGIFGNGAYVFSGLTDSDGDIWFGGIKGDIVCYSPEGRIFRKYEAHPVFCFAEDRAGRILTGGGDGIIAIDKKTGRSETILSDNMVQTILVDGPLWWIGTSGNGVLCMDSSSGKVRSITVNDGLHSNFTRSLVKKDGRLWIGTALGMSCYDIDDDVMVQLPGKEILTENAFRENASCATGDGDLAFGTNNGIVIFNPERILKLKNRGRIFFSDIKVSGRSIRSDFDEVPDVPIDSLTTLTLNYPRNSFTLSMLPLGNFGSNVMFSWKLENFDSEWSEPSQIPTVNYINLAPGRYVLKVRMHEGKVVAERELSVKVNPPFWNTVWFRMLVLMAVAAGVLLCVRIYVHSMRRRHAFEKLLLSLQITEDLRHADANENSGNPVMSPVSGNDDAEEDYGGLIDTAAQEVTEPASAEDSYRSDVDSEKKEMDEEFLAKAMECVKANLSSESFGKKEFSSAMGISQSLLYKKIKTLTDMSVVEFIRSIRLNHAMSLLGSGRYSVTEVSEICGFSTSAYFSKVFKDSFGMSPSEIIP